MSARPLERGRCGHSRARRRRSRQRSSAAEQPRPAPRFWSARDPFRRRMLALADVGDGARRSASRSPCLGPGRRAAAVRLLFLPGLDPRREALRALRPRPPLAPAPDGRRAADDPRVDDHLPRRAWRSSSRLTGLGGLTADEACACARARVLAGSLASPQPRALRLAAADAPGTRRRRRRRRARRLGAAASSSSSADMHASVVGGVPRRSGAPGRERRGCRPRRPDHRRPRDDRRAR